MIVERTQKQSDDFKEGTTKEVRQEAADRTCTPSIKRTLIKTSRGDDK